MGFSAKHFEVVSTVESGFTKEKIESVLADMPCEYAYILHDKDTLEDGSLKKPHFHVYVNFGQTSWNSDNVAKRFGLDGQFVSKVKGRKSDIEEYFTHRNSPDKYQYEDTDVVANYDWQKSRDNAVAKKNKEARAEEIRNKIVTGEWRDYNLHTFVNAKEFHDYKKVIDSAFDYRIRTLKGANRDMQAIYIYGDSGTGKTTLAKDIALEHGYSIYVSSGSNDVLDDYRGEDCVILDDLRPSCMGLSDLLKLLDPHTSSSVKSRYKNKVLECKMIIITTTLPVTHFFNKVYESDGETAVQLQRRCKAVFYLTTKEMIPFVWQPKSRTYLQLAPQINPVSCKYASKDMTLLETEEFLSGLLGGIARDRQRFEEWEQIMIDDNELPFK